MGVNGKLDLICFPGAPNLPLFAGLEFGFFADAGIDVRLKTTPNSIYQIKNLAQGVFQIAGTAFDNVVAYQEGQGAIQLHEPTDLFAFMGGTRIELSLVVAPVICVGVLLRSTRLRQVLRLFSTICLRRPGLRRAIVNS